MYIPGATESQKLQAEVLSVRYRDEKKYCESCHHIGRTFLIDGDKQLSFNKCNCLLRLEAEERVTLGLPKTNIPVKYWNLDFINYRNTGRNEEEKELNRKSMAKLYHYRDNLKKNRKEGLGLYIEGPNGVGKTFISTSLGKEALRQGFSARFHLLSEIVSLTTDSFEDRAISRVLSKLKSCDFLIIDDADKPYHTKSSFKISLFDDLIRYRVQNLKPCIVTANQELKDASETFNESLHSLLSEQSLNVVLVGSDFRKEIHATNSKEEVSNTTEG